MSWPELKGLRFVGGLTISPEFLVMIIAIVLYGSAYIAEVVRGGLAEVPKGLIEAGEALGLTQRSIWTRIKMPMALRTIIPPLGNQWIFAGADRHFDGRVPVSEFFDRSICQLAE